jgi:outer membrane protein
MAGDYKIGYVDMQRSVNESLAGKEAMQKFEEEVKKTEEDLMKDKEDVEKLGEIIKKQSMMLTEDVRREKEKDYLRKQRDFDRKVKDSKSELQLKEAELTNEILEELIPIVQKYGKDNNYSIIFQNEIRILLYASESLDLTDKVMVIYDAEYRKKKK